MRAPSLDDIRAGFVNTALDTIVGEPTYKTIELAHNQCIRNATTIDSQLGGGHHGHAGLVKFTDVYLLRTGNHFNRPVHPGDTPPYVLGMGEVEREACKARWEYDTTVFLTCQRVEKILLSMLENALDTTYLSGIHDPAHGFGHRTIMDVFRYLFQTYGNIGPADIVANQAKMTAAVDPNQPIAHLFKQIEDCQKFATAGQTAITPAQIVKAAETLILQTGKYTTAYREWLSLAEADKTYLNFKTRMTAEYCLQNQIHTTSREAGYGHANAAMALNTEDEHLAAAANEFASATAADRAAFAQLTSTNGELSAQMANMVTQNQQLQEQMGAMQHHLMYMASAHPAPAPHNPGRGGRQRPQQRNRRGANPAWPPPAQPAQAPGYQPNPHQPPAYQPPARYQAPPAQPLYQPAPAYQAPQGPYGRSGSYPPRGYGQPPPPAFPPAYGHGQPFQQRPPRDPNAKRHNNNNYCWSHGGDITDSHSSPTCQRPTPGHNPMATRANTMGGNPKDLHRVWMGT
jgi:hypothetical protein